MALAPKAEPPIPISKIFSYLACNLSRWFSAAVSGLRLQRAGLSSILGLQADLKVVKSGGMSEQHFLKFQSRYALGPGSCSAGARYPGSAVLAYAYVHFLYNFLLFQPDSIFNLNRNVRLKVSLMLSHPSREMRWRQQLSRLKVSLMLSHSNPDDWISDKDRFVEPWKGLLNPLREKFQLAYGVPSIPI